MKIKKISKMTGGAWQAPFEFGASAENVDYTKTVDGSPVTTNLKTELDNLNSNKLDTDGGAGDLKAGVVTADSSATIAAIADIINATTLDEVWGRFNQLKTLANAHELAKLNTATGIHGFRYYNDELSYYDGSSWVVIAAAGGHTIENSSGTSLEQRDNLQFVNLTVTDDSVNNKTIVKNPIYTFNTIAEMNTAISSGSIEEGAVIYVKEDSGGGGGGGTPVTFVFTNVLPATGETNTFYFIENGTSGSNEYDEYVWNTLKTKFELIAQNIIIDATPTQNSSNPVSSGGVYAALAGKQATLTFDNAPTMNSNNPVKSRGIYSSIQNILSQLADTYSTAATYVIGDIVLYAGTLYQCKVDIPTPERWTAAHWEAKTIADLVSSTEVSSDAVPTQGSNNLVQSGGTYDALLDKVSISAGQGLTEEQKANARTNIGAGTSNFSGSYSDLSNIPSFGAAAMKEVDSSIGDGSASTKVPTSAAVASFVENKGYINTVDAAPTSASENAVQSGGVYTALTEKQNNEEWVEITLQAENWINSQYSLESVYPSSTYDITHVLPTSSTSTAQREAWASADCGGYNSSNVIIAHGTIPTVNINIGLCLRLKN